MRTRRALASPEPDAPPRAVELPALWDDAAADALASIVPGGGRASLRDAAETWLACLPPDIAHAARLLLMQRRLAPDTGLWAGRPDSVALNLAAFDEPGLGLDHAALREAASVAADIARTLAPSVPPVLRLTDLDGLLALAGLTYDSQAGRDMAVATIRSLHDAAAPLGAVLSGKAGRVDALLGAEACGVAPRFDWLDAAGRLSRAAMGFLAARGLSVEQALAAALTGRSPLALADASAHAAMRAALAPFLVLPALPSHATPTAPRRELPGRPGGYAGRVTLGGHKVFVRTAEFADGTLGEVSLALPKESAAIRAFADSLGQVVSLALQHGTPLAEVVDLLAGTRFGPAGTVDGDPDVTRASSPLDYLARSLAAAYLPGHALDPVQEEEAAPTLPLDMPPQSRPAEARPKLRVVR